MEKLIKELVKELKMTPNPKKKKKERKRKPKKFYNLIEEDIGYSDWNYFVDNIFE